MKFSLKWLRELAPFTWSLDETVERMTMSGVEVEGIHPQGLGLDQVVVAQILASEKHPGADRLSVCQVETGAGPKQIVCGAKNYAVGDKVPLALPGARLPNGMEIKRSKLRGVESDGMMCSPKELGLAAEAEGLLILPADAQVGQPIAEALGLDDTLLELEITPNRADLLSHWGMAREIAALAELPPPAPSQLLPPDEERRLAAPVGAAPSFPIRVEDSVLCPRYTARVIRGVKVGPSPLWLRRRLESLGHRSISNVVDITNYVLAEIGQPLHAFDLDLLRGPGIIVRRARAGEKILRLDELESALAPEMLVIADAERPVALAGVIGGKETGVSEKTVNLLIESATFQPASIRKTSKSLAASSDSSYRFERGVDVELAAWASHRAVALILQICGGTVEGGLVDCRAAAPTRRRVTCRPARVEALLGMTMPVAEIQQLLGRLSCRVESAPDNTELIVEPPSWRHDLEREIDLIEEIGRVHGAEKIPARMQPASVSNTDDSADYLFARRLRAAANALGLDEAVTYPITSSTRVRELRPGREPVLLANPLSAEMDTLRPTLLTGLMEAGARNLAGGHAGAALFEYGRLFEPLEGGATERPALGILLAGARGDGASWEKGAQGAVCDDYDLKGIVDGLLKATGAGEVMRDEAAAAAFPELEPGRGFALRDGDRVVGFAGRVASRVTRAWKVAAPVFYAELDGGWLRSRGGKEVRYRPWTPYPAVHRDVALTVSAGMRHQALESKLIELARRHAEPKKIALEQIRLFDIFQSEKLGASHKSLAYAMTYRSLEKTLTDAEVNQIHEKIVLDLKAETGVEIRQ